MKLHICLVHACCRSRGYTGCMQGPPSADLTFQHIKKAIHCDLIPSVVHLCSSIIQVQLLVHVVEDAAGVRVARVAGHVISQHQDDLAIGNAQPAWMLQRCWQFKTQLVNIGSI